MLSQSDGLLLYTQGISPGDAIELAASLQRQFPGRQVQPTDFRWRMSRSRTWEPPNGEALGGGGAIAPGGPSFPMDYAYLVLGWLVGTVGKSAAEEAIKATTDVVLRWMRSRRKPARFQLVELLGPDGSCSRWSRCQSQTELVVSGDWVPCYPERGACTPADRDRTILA